MASIFTRKSSLYYYAAFRIPAGSPDGSKKWKQVKQVTKVLIPKGLREREKAEQEALKVAFEFEQNALREAGAGNQGSERILAILREAGDLAAQKRLTASMGREFIRRLTEASTGEALPAEKTIQGWLDEWVKQKASSTKPSTLLRYKASTKALITHLGEEKAALPLDSLTVGILREFRGKLQAAGRTAKTCNHYLKDLNSALRAAVKEDIISRSPAENLDPLPEEDSTERKPFTFEQVSRLLAAAPSQSWRGIILLGAYGGLRLGDAARITRGCIDLQEQCIRYKPQKTTRKKAKKKGPVHLPMHRGLFSFLKSLDLPADPEAPVFPDLAKVSIAGNKGLSSRFVRIIEAAGIPREAAREHKDGSAGRSAHALSFHSLRHTCNSSMLNGGVSQELRMKIVGHADARTNTGYSHAELTILRNAVEAMPDLARMQA
jgi:integrase